jgi:hypothetical protein
MTSVLSPGAPGESLTVAASTGQGRLVKSAVLVVNSAITNNTTTDLQFPTVDDDMERWFIGLTSSDHTAGMIARLLSNGRRMAELDDSLFAVANGMQPTFVPCAPNIQLVLELVNKSGGSVTPVTYTVAYAVNDPNWTIGG